MSKEKIRKKSENKFLSYFEEKGNFTAKQFKNNFDLSLEDAYNILNKYRDKSILIRDGPKWILDPSYSTTYVDWNGNLARLEDLYNHKIFTLLVGPKGTGKNQSMLSLAKKLSLKLQSLNLSLRTREHHILGRLDVKEKSNGTKEISWKKGPLPLSMEEGSVLILDEINSAEPSVLLRLDEALDERMELNYEGEHIEADSNWWVVGIVNPLDHPGTKELPPQLLRRFPARLIYEYPDPMTELKIVKKKVGIKSNDENKFYKILDFFNTIRNDSDLPFTPSVSESLTAAKLMNSEVSMNEILEMTILNALRQWGIDSVNVAKELAISKGVYYEEKPKKKKTDRKA